MSQPPESAGRSDRALVYAVAGIVALVALASLAGLGASQLVRARPAPATVRPSPPPAPSPTEPPDTGPLVFTQPLSAGCAAGDSVYVVSDGGAIGRFAFDRWQLVDATARSLVAATCEGDRLVAVGGGGRVVTVDDRERSVRSDAVQLDDLLGIAPLAGGVIVVGRQGSVQRQDGGGWSPYAQGIDDDLFAVVAFGETSAWAVGAGGATFRLEAAGWRPVATGVRADLRAVAARSVDDAIVAGADGVVLEWTGSWAAIAGLPHVTYRSALRAGDDYYLAGDGGTLLRLTGPRGARQASIIPLSATCTLRALFSRGSDVWIVGSDGGRAAVWRHSLDGTAHWGDCP